MKRSKSSRMWTALALAAALAMLGTACAPSASSPDAPLAPAPGQAQASGTVEATVERPETGGTAQVSPEMEPEIEFFGAIESMGADAWTIGAMTFRATAATEIEDGLAVGDFVKVHARRQNDGSLWAREIEREEDQQREGGEVEFSGTLQAMGADAWTIDGMAVRVTAQTEIEDGIEVGDFVEVHMQVEADGSLVAREIKLHESGSGDVENDNDDNGNANDNGDDNQNVNDNGNDNNQNDNENGDNDNDNQNDNDDDNQNGNDNGNDNGGDDNGNDNSNENDNDDYGNDNDDQNGNDNGDNGNG